MHSKHNSWEKIFLGVPNQSIPSPSLFNIFMYDLLFKMYEADFSSYADDNIPFVTCDSIENFIKSLENDSKKLFKWFAENQIKVSTNESNTTNVDGNKIQKKEL